HPLLAPPCRQLVYDLRLLPATASFTSASQYRHCGYQPLSAPMHAGKPRCVRLISPDFPWSFDLDFSSQGLANSGQSRINAAIRRGEDADPHTITCLDILASLHMALQQPLTDVEWGSADDRGRARILRALRNHDVLRVDWLGSKVLFGGLVRDDEFARSRLFPGTEEPTNTWVVKFRKL
ncbi:hypothetical protein BU15DRAFT_50167, partial [Melanogaster broomeanus]